MSFGQKAKLTGTELLETIIFIEDDGQRDRIPRISQGFGISDSG